MLCKNEMKSLFFKIYCYISFGIVYLLYKWIGFLKFYIYDPVNDIEQADHLVMTFKNSKSIVTEIN